MIKYITNFSFFLILILPFSLISGPAIPDISISLTGLFFLYFLSYGKQFSEIYNNKWAFFSIIFWLFILFISLFSENKHLAYRDAVIFIRILAIPIFIYFWILSDEYKIKLLRYPRLFQSHIF